MRHHVPGRAFLWTCCECGRSQREDQEPYEEDCWGGCRRITYLCNGVDCKRGPVARDLWERLRRERCPVCKGAGLIEIDGDEAPCPVGECLAAELLTRDYVAERIFSPSYHREELGITRTLSGRFDHMGPGRVINTHICAMPDDAVYIGRGSLWGNPFSHQSKGAFATIRMDTREESIEAYRLWLTSDLELSGWPKPTREQVTALRGRTLACFCAPKACHGDVLLVLAESWPGG